MNLQYCSPAKRMAKYSVLLGTASFWALATTTAEAQNAEQTQTAQAGQPEVSEQVLVTGSLIHGAAAVGVPVQNFGQQDFLDTGAVTTSDLFKDVPAVAVPIFQGGGNGAVVNQDISVNIHSLSAGNAPRTLMMIDGMRYPAQGNSVCQTDPSIIPTLAVDHLDLLADGASATYGSDAVAGVLNIVLKRGFDGAITQFQVGASPTDGHTLIEGSQLWGKTWDGGDITLTMETYDQAHTLAKNYPYYTENFFATEGVDNRILLNNSNPGTVVFGSFNPVTGITTYGKPALASNAAGQNPTTATYNTTGLPGTAGAFSATLGTSCGNCYAIPTGQNGQSLTWAAVAANTPTGPNNTTLGTANEHSYDQYGWGWPQQDRMSVTATVDQNITNDIQFFGDAVYDNRRSTLLSGTGTPAPLTSEAGAWAIPAGNPYIPTGAPSGLVVYYDFSGERPVQIDGNEIAGHYDGGFNVKLPFGWLGKLYYQDSDDTGIAVESNAINSNNVSAALGWSLPQNGVVGSFTKPANVPYLNLFCDPNQFTCNSAATLAYIMGYRDYTEENNVSEFSGEFDGPLFELPGGEVKAAVGASYYHLAYQFKDEENWNEPALSDVINLTDHEDREVVAGYAQVNIPLVGDNNKLPLVEKLDVEASGRYDTYNQFGGTFNPKISGTWGVIDGLSLKSSWGTSFRAPSFTEESAIAATLIQSINVNGGAASNTITTCPVVGAAAASGSPAAAIDGNCASSLQSLGGISLANGAGIAAAVRSSTTLSPEKAQNLSAGFEWAPTDTIFNGLDIEATYFFVKIRNKLAACPNAGLDSPLSTSCFITPATYNEPFNGSISAAADPIFYNAVLALQGNPKSQLPTNLATSNVAYIFDGAIRNIGWQTLQGVDFNSSYNWTMDGIGNWRWALDGTYIIDNYSQTEAGQPVVSVYSTPVNGTRNSGGRLRYRTSLGWTGGPDDAWGLTGFMTFWPHVNSNGGALPPACFLEGNPACNASGMPQYAQYTQQYSTLTNYVPGVYVFDLQVSYKTKDTPANPYLRDINVTLMVSDLFNRAPPLQYVLPSGGGFGHSFGPDISPDQRTFLLTVTKSW